MMSNARVCVSAVPDDSNLKDEDDAEACSFAQALQPSIASLASLIQTLPLAA